MKRLNVIFCLSSLSVLLVTVERFSFTTRVLLQPGGFLRLHEVIQICLVILLTVVLPAWLLKEVSNNFEALQTGRGAFLALLFIVGVYFYATGNGLHEVSSFNLNQFCSVAKPVGDVCGTFFINDFYTGNILYFAGGGLMVVTLMLMEKSFSRSRFTNGDMWIALANAMIYALAIFAYAAFDRVLVGLVYVLITAAIADALFLTVRRLSLHYPVITYTAATYTLGALLALVIRLR
jgi:hypothetical protein